MNEQQVLLKVAMAEINAVLIKHNLAASVALLDGENVDCMNVYPEWTGLTVKGNVVKAFIGDTQSGNNHVNEAAIKRLELLAGMLAGLKAHGSNIYTVADHLIKSLEDKGWKIDTKFEQFNYSLN